MTLQDLKSHLAQSPEAASKVAPLLLEAFADQIWFWDIQQPEMFWLSKPLLSFLGYDEDDEGIDPENVIASKSIDQLKNLPVLPLSEFTETLSFINKNGHESHLQSSGIVNFDTEGKCVCIMGTLDIHAIRKEFELRDRRRLIETRTLYAATKLVLEEATLMFDAPPDAIVQVDGDGKIVKANRQASLLFECSTSELMESSVEELIPMGRRGLHEEYRKHYNNKPEARPMGTLKRPLQVQTKSGRLVEVDIQLKPITTSYGYNTIAIIRDVSEKVKLAKDLNAIRDINKSLQREASTDALTGVLNRHYFDKLGDHIYSQCTENRKPLSVLMIDIDHFKHVNDDFGHTVGDEVLVWVAEQLQKMVRENDIIGRFGGEEFVALIPHTPMGLAYGMARRIVSFFHDTLYYHHELPVRVTLSVGVTERKDDDQNLTQIITLADKYLYQAKHLGRDRVIIGIEN